MKRFLVWRNRDKADTLVNALTVRGYEDVTSVHKADLALIDYERRASLVQLHELHRQGKPVFIYPHAARTAMIWDGLVEPWKYTACNFVFAEGHKEIMQSYGYPFPVEAVGWTYSEVRTFRPCGGGPSPLRGKRVLFAPIHPNFRPGQFAQGDSDANGTVFRKLLDLLDAVPALSLHVRYGRHVEESGLWDVDDARVTWESARYDLADSVRAIEAADIVVGHNTFAFIAVALGKPTVMFNEAVTPHNVDVKVLSWEKYRHLTAFPLDLLTSADDVHATASLLMQACRGDEGVETWKRRMIGEPFDGDRFVQFLEQYAQNVHPAPAEHPIWRCLKCGVKVDPYAKYCQPCLKYYRIPTRLNRYHRRQFPVSEEERRAIFDADRKAKK